MDETTAGAPALEPVRVGQAHARDTFADRFRREDGFSFRVRGRRMAAEGTWVGQEPPEVVVPDLIRTCEYCGSIMVRDFLTALETSGAHYSGSDWKYGWPHKFYIDIPCAPYRTSSMGRYYTNNEGQRVAESHWGERAVRHHKFYSEHMVDATDKELADWARIAEPLLGVGFYRADGKVAWRAQGRGVQRWGTVR